jgi:hypothetical protein
VSQLSADPELDAWAKQIMARVLSKTKRATPCKFCSTGNLEWCKDNTDHWLLRDRTSKALHSCPKRRLPTRAFKPDTWRVGRMRRR